MGLVITFSNGLYTAGAWVEFTDNLYLPLFGMYTKHVEPLIYGHNRFVMKHSQKTLGIPVNFTEGSRHTVFIR